MATCRNIKFRKFCREVVRFTRLRWAGGGENTRASAVEMVDILWRHQDRYCNLQVWIQANLGRWDGTLAMHSGWC